MEAEATKRTLIVSSQLKVASVKRSTRARVTHFVNGSLLEEIELF